MSTLITIEAERRYNVTFGQSWLARLKEIQAERKSLVITSARVLEAIGVSLDGSNIFLVPDGEAAKDVLTLKAAWDFLESRGIERGDLIVAIGGGSVTDFAGFAAATWLRGVDWIAIPTTLAGMVDASVGGKTGINGSKGKNLIGAFHSPKEVIIDLTLLASLPDRDFRAGLAEVVKCGFIADGEILRTLQSSNLERLRSADSRATLIDLVQRSISVKAKIVSEDFRESGSRVFLNYGHTLGHAIEHLSKYQLRHGEAVSIGLNFAGYLGFKHLGLSRESYLRHRTLLEQYDLPIRFDADAFDPLLSAMLLDKKNRDGMIRFVLLREEGNPVLFSELSEVDLRAAYQEVMS